LTHCKLKLPSGSVSSFTTKTHSCEAWRRSALSPAARTEAEQAECWGVERRRLTRQHCQAALASRRDEVSLGLGCWVGSKSHAPRFSSTSYRSGLSFTASESLSMQISQLKPNTKKVTGFEWHHTARAAGEKSICPLGSLQDEWKANQHRPKADHCPRQCSWLRLGLVHASSFLTDRLTVKRCCPIATHTEKSTSVKS